jgi:hypothetical protein
VRETDNVLVMVKDLYPNLHPHEADIAQFFSSEALAGDPRNHCVPVYEMIHFQLEAHEPEIFMIMPLLRKFNDPPFETVGQTVDFFHQVFEVSVLWTT